LKNLKVRKNISIDDGLLLRAIKKAKSMGFNFSSYVTYLINRDLNGETAITELPKKDTKIKGAIDNIMGD
jgi:hypothetical protein